MKEKINNKVNFLIIFFITIIVLYLALKDDFTGIINQILNIQPIFLILSFLLIFAYYFLRTIILNDIIIKFKKDFSFKETFGITLKTQFFNGITPFSSGGQPFQVYMLKKAGIKISNSTNIIIQNFIVYQIALVILGIIAIIYNHFFDFFKEIALLKNLVTIGFIINILVIIILFALAFTTKLNKILGYVFIKLLQKTKIIKNSKQLVSKWEEYVENFHDGAIVLLNNKKIFLKGIFYNLIALCSLYLIPIVLLYGMGNFNVVTPVESIITSAYVMLIGSFVPIPGGTGGLEYGFVVFYGNFVKGSALNAIMLLWRFITYYFSIILGAIALNTKRR